MQKFVIHVTQAQTEALMAADWRGDGPIRLNASLRLDELQPSLVLTHARLVLGALETEGGVRLTAAGCFNRKFVARMVEAFRWPGYEPEQVWLLNKVLNERDVPPLNYLHAVLAIAGLVRRYKGMHRISRLGRSLLAAESAGALNALLFDTTFNAYALDYLDGWAMRDDFQTQAPLTLYLMSRFEDIPRTAEAWMNATTVRADQPESEYPDIASGAFAARILRYLEWFGMMAQMKRAANDDWRVPRLFRKTPLFDRFLSFCV